MRRDVDEEFIERRKSRPVNEPLTDLTTTWIILAALVCSALILVTVA